MARRLILSLMILGSLAFASWAQRQAALSPLLAERLDDSRVAMLPSVLPNLPGFAPLEQARAQALLDFLHTHRLYGQGSCDVQRDLCLPIFVSQAQTDPLPQVPAAVMYPPVEGILAEGSDGAESQHQIYIAQAGALIFAPYDGTVLATTRLSGGRMLLSFEHERAGNTRVFSVLTGQIVIDVQPGDFVRKGQPLGRARPRRDASTRLRFELRTHDAILNPSQWLEML